MLLPDSELYRLLQLDPRRREPTTGLRHSAVMMILFERDPGFGPESHLVLIMKTIDASRHSGQIAFPGGRVEPGEESSLAAALRETNEEIGIAPEGLQVLGTLGYFSTLTTGYDVGVYVARPTAPLVYHPHQKEVAAIFEVPLGKLYEQFDPAFQPKSREDFLHLHFHLESEPYLKFRDEELRVNWPSICVWGFTARVLHHFFTLVKVQSFEELSQAIE